MTWTAKTVPTRRAASAAASTAACTEPSSPRTWMETSPPSTEAYLTIFTLAVLTAASAASTAPTKPIVSIMTRTESATGLDFGLLAASGVLTIVPGAIVIWFIRNNIAKGFALGRV